MHGMPMFWELRGFGKTKMGGMGKKAGKMLITKTGKGYIIYSFKYQAPGFRRV